MMNKEYDVCMVGLGPVGTTSGACIAKQGFRVVGVDIDPARVSTFQDGKAPFMEPGINELVKEVVDNGNFAATTDLAAAAGNARIIMIAVGTPTPPESGRPDLSYLDAACRTIGESLKKTASKGVIVVVRSTVPPGTMRNRLAKIIEEASGLKAGVDFHVAANPEFLREGKAIYDFFNTSRVVVGADNIDVAAQIHELYREVKTNQRLSVALESAEFAKYVDNTWHALKVAYANEIGRICAGFGGNPDETTEIFLADTNLNISPYYLRPGFAFGGSCLPKDTRGLTHLAHNVGMRVPVIESILDSNNEHIARAADIISARKPKTVGMLGVAFKEYVDDLREAPALMLAKMLTQRGIKVIAHDFAFKAGDKLKLPDGFETLEITPISEAIAQDVIVVMHRLPDYKTATFSLAGKVIDITTITH